MKMIFKDQKGISIIEALVAFSIFAVIIMAGYSAMEFFNKDTKKEMDRLGSVGDFNTVAKDLLKFAEGAGVSTAYLNLPVLVKDCVEGLPCIKKLEGSDNFVTPPESDIHPKLLAMTCSQFYKEGQGTLMKRPAFPNLGLSDVIAQVNDMELKIEPSLDLYTHWPLKDTSSPPLLMMKTLEGGVFLSMFKKQAVEHSRMTNEARATPLEHAFFETDADAKSVASLLGKPFLIFNSVYPSHFVIQYAADIKNCSTDPNPCLIEMNKANITPVTDLNAALDPSPGFTIFAVRFRPIAQSGDEEKKYSFEGSDVGFFSRIRDAQKLPTECYSAWSMDTEQPMEDYFFPSRVYSVANMSESASDLADPAKPLNVLHLNHYYGSDKMSGVAGTMDRGLIVAMPIEISTYSVEKNEKGGGKDLVAKIWHADEITSKIRIRGLKGPFAVTRKVGSSEVGIWYNPLVAKKPESKP